MKHESQIRTHGDIQATRTNTTAHKISAGTEGGKLEWLNASQIEDYQYVVLELEVPGNDQLSFELEFYNSGDTDMQNAEPTLSCRFGFIPSLRVTTYFDLTHLDNQTLFIPRTPGRLKGVMKGRALSKSDIDRICIRLNPRYNAQSFILHQLYLSNEKPDCSLADQQPLVDPLGQARFREWPQKTPSVKQMISDLQRAKDQATVTSFGESYSKYGGMKNKSFGATGYFRIEHDGTRWWMVDPDGYAFFSTGVDCIGPKQPGRIDGIEALYEWLPDENSDYSVAYSTRNDTRFFDFFTANLYRAFGTEWKKDWSSITRSRMVEWGFNTIANWSDPEFRQSANLPYVLNLTGFPTTMNTIFRDFPDVYSAEYEQNAETYAQELQKYKDDPYLIGYFMTNEPKWGFAGHINIAREMFRSKEPFASKQACISFLMDKYDHRIEALNVAWNMSLASFENIYELSYDQLEDQADADLFEFSADMVEQFVRIPAQALKRVDRHHLNLGMRYAWISTDMLYRGSDYFDVFSINCYQFKPDADLVQTIHQKSGKPIMIGEFHFGAPDVGMIAYGLKSVATQKERALAYRYYVEQAAAMDELVGVHYFQWNDQPTLGRFDGESFQIGLVDTCHKPYADFIDGIVEAHQNIPDIRLGQKQPLTQPPEPIQTYNF